MSHATALALACLAGVAAATPSVAAGTAAKTAAAAPAPSSSKSTAGASKAAPAATYKASVESWRKEREEDLRSEGGWLTVAGLFWLKEGENSFGTDPGNAIVLPPGSAPAHAGVFVFKGGKIVIRVEGGAPVILDGKAVHAQEVKADQPGPPDKLTLNALTMYVIKRGERFGIRLKDKNSKHRTEFAGLQWFPISESYKVLADWVPYVPPRKIAIANVLGQTEDSSCPGYASFTLNGATIKLEPLGEPGDKELSFLIRDGTSGKETYGAGRFLDTDAPQDGKLLIDFNKAYSPPCAFTEFATCPLPPKQNQMAVRIEAGEKYTAHH
jgi:uncharacterized protein (DUF1684 family)